jgi:hypothetical protein
VGALPAPASATFFAPPAARTTGLAARRAARPAARQPSAADSRLAKAVSVRGSCRARLRSAGYVAREKKPRRGRLAATKAGPRCLHVELACAAGAARELHDRSRLRSLVLGRCGGAQRGER